MTKRSAERTEFLADVLSTAVEGGIGYWCQIESWNSADTDNRTKVQVAELEEEDADHPAVGQWVTLDRLGSALGAILRREVELGDWVVEDLRSANDTNDAGEVDAGLADVVFQVALLGKVVYG